MENSWQIIVSVKVLETKYKCSQTGLTFTEKWSTDNQLATTIELADKPLKGAKLVFDSTFSPQTGIFTFYLHRLHTYISSYKK